MEEHPDVFQMEVCENPVELFINIDTSMILDITFPHVFGKDTGQSIFQLLP
jgi:hypothetical protein